MKPRQIAYQDRIFEILLKEINPLSRVQFVLSGYLMDRDSTLDSRFYENIYLRKLLKKVPVWSKEFSFGHTKDAPKGIPNVHELSMNTIKIKYPFFKSKPWDIHPDLKTRVERMFSILRGTYKEGKSYIKENRRQKAKIEKLDFLVSCGCEFQTIRENEEYSIKLIDVGDQEYLITQNFRAFENPQFRSAHYQQMGDTFFTNTLIQNIIPATKVDYEIILDAVKRLEEKGDLSEIVKIGRDIKYPVRVELGRVREGKMVSVTPIASPWHNFGIYGGKDLEF